MAFMKHLDTYSTQELFTTHFWRIYEKLRDDGPQYFQFLTLLAIHVFCAQRVDVAIMEVGIGGEYDTTNVIRRPRVCGITSLGIDHTKLLGNTIEDIAWHKVSVVFGGNRAGPSYWRPRKSVKYIIQVDPSRR